MGNFAYLGGLLSIGKVSIHLIKVTDLNLYTALYSQSWENKKYHRLLPGAFITSIPQTFIIHFYVCFIQKTGTFNTDYYWCLLYEPYLQLILPFYVTWNYRVQTSCHLDYVPYRVHNGKIIPSAVSYDDHDSCGRGKIVTNDVIIFLTRYAH